MKKSPDISQKAFDSACRMRGFVPQNFLGYYRLPSGVHVSVRNAGPRRRDQLAYLIAEDRKRELENERRLQKSES